MTLGVLFEGPYRRDPAILGSIFGSPVFGTPTWLNEGINLKVCRDPQHDLRYIL